MQTLLSWSQKFDSCHPLRGPATAASNKVADGRYRSAGRFSTEGWSLAVAEEAERHAAKVADSLAGGLICAAAQGVEVQGR